MEMSEEFLTSVCELCYLKSFPVGQFCTQEAFDVHYDLTKSACVRCDSQFKGKLPICQKLLAKEQKPVIIEVEK